jgi:hypothetical protein
MRIGYCFDCNAHFPDVMVEYGDGSPVGTQCRSNLMNR